MKARTVAAGALAAILAGLPVTPALSAADCTLAAGSVNFGIYDPLLATPDDSTGSIVVTCSNNPPPGQVDIAYVLKLSRGLSASFAPRQMAFGAARMNYYLYLNAAHSQLWGDGTSGTSFASGTFRLNGNSTQSRTHTVYGRMPALQDSGIGSYSDVLVVTIEF